MSFLPKYQWLTEYVAPSCGTGCDIVQVDASADKKFQVSFAPTAILNEDFDGNDIALPMEQIWVGLGSFGSGSGTGLYYGITFDMDLTAENHFINSFSFFFEGQPYCFIFAVDVNASGTEITEYGGITVVKISEVFSYDKYTSAFSQVMSPFGISIIEEGSPSFTVYGFPANTMVQTGNAAPYNTAITSGVGTASINLSNFVPYNNQACYFNISSLNLTPGATCSPAIFTLPISVATNKRIIATVNYTNNLSFDYIELELRIRDSGFNLIDTVVGTVEQGTNTLVFNYETVSADSFYFDFTLTDLACGFADELYGFCFNSIKIETIAQLDSISVEGCTTANVPFTEEYNNLYNSLITMNTGSLPNGLITTGKWKLILTDDESNTVTTITYETIAGTSCVIRNLLRLKWWSDCSFSDLDYAGLPFTNDVYVKGYSISQPLDNKERIMNVLSSGELEMVYNYSIEKSEFTLGIYTANFYKTLQRAFEHKYITIGGTYYKQDSDSKLTKKPEGDKYSAKIELVESGSAVISSKCCC